MAAGRSGATRDQDEITLNLDAAQEEERIL
jgi:hypothetical protein